MLRTVAENSPSHEIIYKEIIFNSVEYQVKRKEDYFEMLIGYEKRRKVNSSEIGVLAQAAQRPTHCGSPTLN